MNKKVSTEFAILVILILAGYFGFMFWQNDKEDNAQIQNLTVRTGYDNSNNQNQVEINDKSCQKDEDCIMAMTECSCDCGVPINKTYEKKYLDAQEKKCTGYNGPWCKIKCANELKCIDNVCKDIHSSLNPQCDSDVDCKNKLPDCEVENRFPKTYSLCVENTCNCTCGRDSDGKIIELCE